MARVKTIGSMTKPAAHLSQRSQQIWRELVPRRARSPERRALMQTALEALDRADQCRRQLDEEGLTFATKTTGAVHVHPLLRVEKDARATFARIWGQLELTHYEHVDGIQGRGFLDDL